MLCFAPISALFSVCVFLFCFSIYLLSTPALPVTACTAVLSAVAQNSYDKTTLKHYVLKGQASNRTGNNVSVKRKLALENLASVYCVCAVPSERVAIADQMHHSYSKLTRLPFQPGSQPCLGRAVGILGFSQRGTWGHQFWPCQTPQVCRVWAMG